MLVDRSWFVDGQRAAEPERSSAAPDAGFLWVWLRDPEPDELVDACAPLELDLPALADLGRAHQRPKVDRLGEHLVVVCKTVEYSPDREAVETGEVVVLLADRAVVTVVRGPVGGVAPALRELSSSPRALAAGASAVLRAVVERVVADHARVLSELDDDIDDIEQEVFSPTRDNHAERIYRCKREVLVFRRAVTDLPDVLAGLSEPSGSVSDDLRVHLRGAHDRALRAAEHALALDELLDSALSVNLAKITIRQNEDMRRISAWVAIAAIPTAVAGIYGMNFTNMPEIDTRYGYFVVLVGIAVACAGLYAVFRRSGWL